MSVVRGGSDKLRCDWGSCKDTFWAGSLWHAVSTVKAEKQAVEAGWWVSTNPHTYRHLCPNHAFLGTRNE